MSFVGLVVSPSDNPALLDLLERVAMKAQKCRVADVRFFPFVKGAFHESQGYE